MGLLTVQTHGGWVPVTDPRIVLGFNPRTGTGMTGVCVTFGAMLTRHICFPAARCNLPLIRLPAPSPRFDGEKGYAAPFPVPLAPFTG